MDGAGLPIQVYVDADGTITFSDLPPELEEVARLLEGSAATEANDNQKQEEGSWPSTRSSSR